MAVGYVAWYGWLWQEAVWRSDEDWGRHGNKRLHDWAFETLISHLEYKAEERGIDVERVDEAELKTSKTCCQ